MTWRLHVSRLMSGTTRLGMCFYLLVWDHVKMQCKMVMLLSSLVCLSCMRCPLPNHFYVCYVLATYKVLCRLAPRVSRCDCICFYACVCTVGSDHRQFYRMLRTHCQTILSCLVWDLVSRRAFASVSMHVRVSTHIAVRDLSSRRAIA